MTKCQWNPRKHRRKRKGERGCQHEAVLLIGKYSQMFACMDCASLPRNMRFKYWKALPSYVNPIS